MLLVKLLTDDGRLLANFVDKIEVRNYVRGLLGEEALIPQALVTDQPSELRHAQLPQRVVVKAAGGSGMVKVVPDTSKADWDALIPEFTDWMSRDYSRMHREKLYAHVQPRLLVEHMLQDDASHLPSDYKVYVLNGKAQLIQYISGRGSDVRLSTYFPDGRLMPQVSKGFPQHDHPPVLDANLPEMVKVAEVLSKGFDFVRVDLFWVDARIYFGELTFYPAAVRTEFKPREFDAELGAVWRLGGHISDKWASSMPPNS